MRREVRNRPVGRTLGARMAAQASFSAAVLVVTCLATGCSGGASAEGSSPGGNAFDQQRAWNNLIAQVELGPRPSGTEALEGNRVLIEKELRAAGLTPRREEFTASTPLGEIKMANVIADLPGRERDGKPAPIVILCSHFDTKRMDTHVKKSLRDGVFVGANDGASSTAVLLELARVMAAGEQRDVTYRFLFVDGEEATRWDWNDPDNRYGSRHHVDQLRETGEWKQVRAAVVLDLVGDADLTFTNDLKSNKKLLKIFFDAARRLGMEELTHGRYVPVLDDHLSFLEIGIPSCDLIDMDFKRRDERGREIDLWHTVDDTPENCSADSLGKVGRVVLEGLPGVEAYVLR